MAGHVLHWGGTCPAMRISSQAARHERLSKLTDPGYAHVVILADKSGSMADETEPGSGISKAVLATKGVHDLIAGQAAAPGRTTFTLAQFATGMKTVASFAGADDFALLAWQCRPAGGTALLDAMGDLIASTGAQLAALREDHRPGRVYFAIATDGEENASSEHTLESIRSMVETQARDYGWEFLFLGAGIDAFAEAGSMGIPQAATMDVASAGIEVAYASAGEAIIRSRATGQSVSYSDDERKRSGGGS